ncbi:MAG: glutamate racemase [Candidatus Pacebacteria bacterium]|nr:glutamate racemase [Candidatus Paceibacterota bacterium]
MKLETYKKGPIGIFDSGFGGLEIAKHIAKELPQYDFIYLGDTARTPYGSRSQEVIFNFTKQAVDFLLKKNCPLVILACNTASSEALRKIQQECLSKKYPDKKVLGVIIPAVEEAIEITKNNRVGVIATEGTIKSGAFTREIKKRNPKVKVFQTPAPLLAPIVEAGEHNSEIAKMALQKYLKPLVAKKIDTLILGCTHYGILEKQTKEILRQNSGQVGRDVQVISEGKVVAEKLADYLQRHPEIEKQLSKKSQHVFLTTDLTTEFQTLGTQFFGKPIIARKIDLP